jgi:F0F1-type ATP synthase assembly protein I
MSSTAKNVTFWVVIVVSAVLLLKGFQQSQHSFWSGAVEIWIGLFWFVGAALPLVRRQRMRVRVLFGEPRALSLPVQVTFQVMYVAFGVWFWWQAVADFAAKR